MDMLAQPLFGCCLWWSWWRPQHETRRSNIVSINSVLVHLNCKIVFNISELSLLAPCNLHEVDCALVFFSLGNGSPIVNEHVHTPYMVLQVWNRSVSWSQSPTVSVRYFSARLVRSFPLALYYPKHISKFVLLIDATRFVRSSTPQNWLATLKSFVKK